MRKMNLTVIRFLGAFLFFCFTGTVFADQPYDVGQQLSSEEKFVQTPGGKVAVLITRTEVKQIIPMDGFPEELAAGDIIYILENGVFNSTNYEEDFFTSFLLKGPSAEHQENETTFVLSPTDDNPYRIEKTVEDKVHSSPEMAILSMLTIFFCAVTAIFLPATVI